MHVQVCQEQNVKWIRPNHHTSVISKRNTEVVSEQHLMLSTTVNGHCDLPEHDEEFPTFIFVYNEGANLDKIINLIKRYNRNSASVLLAQPAKQLHMIIFQMNRAAYLQVGTGIKCVHSYNYVSSCIYVHLCMHALTYLMINYKF